MQSHTYSVFSTVALVLHLIFNRNLLFGRRIETAHGKRYRLFLFGVLTQLLAYAGVGEIVQAGDGVEALATFDKALADGHEFDFVLTDLWMPNKNGVELVKALRADARFSRIPVFAVTADAEFVHDKRSAIFDGILLKPITYDMLMEMFADERR